MNAQQFQDLVREEYSRIMDERRNKTIEDAGAALDNLSRAVTDWSQTATAKAQAQERLAEAKRVLETTEAELILEASADGRIDGKNKETRELQATQLLHTEAQNGHPYGLAQRAYHEARVAQDQAGLDENIAAEQLSTAKLRCRIIEAQLIALGVE